MRQDELLYLARQAGCNEEFMKMAPDWLERFARLVAAHEREEIARMADEYATWGGSNFYDWFKKLATAIRQRGSAD